jgi:hypothetical protein
MQNNATGIERDNIYIFPLCAEEMDIYMGGACKMVETKLYNVYRQIQACS